MRARISELTGLLERAPRGEELERARAEIQSMRAQMDELAVSADEEITAARQRADQAVGQAEGAARRAAELEKALSNAESRLASAESELIEAVRARDAARQELTVAGAESAEADRLRSALTAAIDRITEAEQSAAQAREQFSTLRDAAAEEISSLRDEVETKTADLEKFERAVLEFEGESRDLKARVEELELELEVANAKPRPNADEFQRSRRRRLAKQRKVLREQSTKIRRATEALRDRLDQCDAVLQKRAELAQAYQAIVDMRQKNAKREVRGGVLFGVVGMMAVIGMMGAVSWFVAGRVAPGEYAASVVIRAQAGPRQTLSEEDAVGWQAYMTGLTADPRFLEQAAARMKQRGIATLGTAGELGREVKDRLTVDTPSPDEIRLEWRGEGAERTRRILDTYAVALAGASNQARARRSDQATTEITQEAVASSEPLDTKRIEMAGMVFGGSTGFMLLTGGLIWRRLSAAKARFERDIRMDPLLDDSQWQMPPRG